MDPNSILPPISSPGETPDKYIRTFETDSSIVKQGGVPTLAKVERTEPSPAERLVASSPIPPEPDRTLDFTPVRTPEPEPVPVSAPSEGPAPLKTYSQDFRNRLKETNASTATLIAAEQDAGAHVVQVVAAPPPEQNRTVWYIIAGVILLIAGGVGVYIGYAKYLSTHSSVLVAPAARAPIFVDSSEPISGSGATLLQAIAQSVAKPLPPNTVRELTVSSTTSNKSIFASLGIVAPGILLRNILPAGNMVGVVKTSAGQSPFFILSVDAYSATFSGMLSWEPTLSSDMKSLYPPYPASVVASSTATSTTATTTAMFVIPKNSFRDEVVSNHDVRVYRDSLGRSVMLYGYWDPNTLVIARDPASFAEILARLATTHAE